MSQSTRNGGPARRTGEESSFLGVSGVRPGFVVVLVFLTLTVGMVAFRMLRDTASRNAEAMVRESVRLFAPGSSGEATGGPVAPDEVEKRVREWTGARLTLPREEDLFTFHGVTKERIGGRTAAAVRFSHEEDICLLVVVKQAAPRGATGVGGIFSGQSFLSGESEGRSFVFWERGAAQFFLVSDADLTRTFDLVRRYLASTGGD